MEDSKFPSMRNVTSFKKAEMDYLKSILLIRLAELTHYNKGEKKLAEAILKKLEEQGD